MCSFSVSLNGANADWVVGGWIPNGAKQHLRGTRIKGFPDKTMLHTKLWRVWIPRTCICVIWEACNATNTVYCGKCFCTKATEAEDRGNDASLLFVLTMHGWITPRNHELFNFHLEKLSSRSSYYERICSIGYNSHLNGSLHLLEGIRTEAFNKRLNLSDKWDKCIHDPFLPFAALIPSEGIPLHTCGKWDILHHSVTLERGPFRPAGRQFTVKSY